jgi:outer membrane usher protein
MGCLLLWMISDAKATEEVEFDPALLAPSPHAADISHFNKGQMLLAGSYDSDIYLNEQLVGRHTIRLDQEQQSAKVTLCLDPELLQLAKVKPKAIGHELSSQLLNPATCVPPQVLSSAMTWRYVPGKLALYLSIPQSLLLSSRQNDIDPSQWQQGEPVATLNYDMNSYYSDTPHSHYDSQYLGLQLAASLGVWRLHHSSNLQNGGWQSNSTYLQRSLPAWRSRLTLGQSWSHGDFFDSVSYLGANVTTEPQMLPEFQRSFAPVVRGIARTQARISIEQNNIVVYETTVAPGPFAIDDFYPAGYGGDLKVTVHEADGSLQQFTVPYASVPRMVREDVTFYDTTLGWLRNQQSFQPDSPFGQFTLQHGFNNLFTAYTGATLIPDYGAALVGVGLNTTLGAISFDVTHSRLDDPIMQLQQGESYRVTYSRLLRATDTNLTLASYRYSNQEYYSLNEAIQRLDLNGPSTQYEYGHSKQRLDVNISQPLGAERGDVYLAWGRNYYWQRSGHTDNGQVGYGSRVWGVSYQLSLQKSWDSQQGSSTLYNLSLSLPLGSSSLPDYLQLQLSHDPELGDGIQGSLSGTLDKENRSNYNLNVSQRSNNTGPDQHSVAISGGYNADKLYLSANGSYDNLDTRQYGLGVRGALVAFSGGILPARDVGETFAIIEAPHAKGAKLSSAQVEVDANGYAIAPYLTPYSANQIALEPGDMARSVELVNSSQIVIPDAGAAMKVTFATRRGYSLLVNGKLANGEPLPFGADILSVWGEPLGIVGQGGQLYAKVESAKGYLIVRWGQQECLLPYQITGNIDEPLQQMAQSVVCGSNELSSHNELKRKAP